MKLYAVFFNVPLYVLYRFLGLTIESLNFDQIWVAGLECQDRYGKSKRCDAAFTYCHIVAI